MPRLAVGERVAYLEGRVESFGSRFEAFECRLWVSAASAGSVSSHRRSTRCAELLIGERVARLYARVEAFDQRFDAAERRIEALVRGCARISVPGCDGSASARPATRDTDVAATAGRVVHLEGRVVVLDSRLAALEEVLEGVASRLGTASWRFVRRRR
jgi:hypothetical protein